MTTLDTIKMDLADWRKILRVRVRFDRDASWYPRPGWVWTMQLGRGAGYRCGRTFYIARNLLRRQDHRTRFDAAPWQVGFTRNGNAVPYTRH